MSDMRGLSGPRPTLGWWAAAGALGLLWAGAGRASGSQPSSQPAGRSARAVPTSAPATAPATAPASAPATAPADQEAARKLALRSDPGKGLPTLPDDNSAGLFGRMLAYLVVVAMLGAAAVFVAKRYFPRGKASLGRIRVLDSAYLAPRKQLHILEVGHQKFLVASTREHVSMIAELRDSFGEAFERQQARADVGAAPADPPDGEAQ